MLEENRSAAVNTVVHARELYGGVDIRKATIPPDLGGGRLLIYFPNVDLACGTAEQETAGFFDVNNIPPWVGFHTLARSYKNEAESLLLRQPDLSIYIPGVSSTERRRYDEIKSAISRNAGVVLSDANPQPAARVSGGILNGRAINKIKPAYPATAREAGASGKVEVRIVFDEKGNVIWAKAISGHPELRQAAEDAAWKPSFLQPYSPDNR